MATNKKARVTMKYKATVYGEFVKLSDYQELAAKGMVRFVTVKLADLFKEKPVAENTRLYNVNQIEFIQLF